MEETECEPSVILTEVSSANEVALAKRVRARSEQASLRAALQKRISDSFPSGKPVPVSVSAKRSSFCTIGTKVDHFTKFLLGYQQFLESEAKDLREAMRPHAVLQSSALWLSCTSIGNPLSGLR